MKLNVLLLLFNSILWVNCLPLFSSIAVKIVTSNIQDKDISSTPTSASETILPSPPIEQIEETEEQCPDTDYPIPVERFAQLISTHWQFDHLDSIKSGTYKLISEQFQKHISISIETSQQQDTVAPTRQRSFTSLRFSSWDMMDLEILHAQIFGAIQAHTEGSLHLAWDRLADKLGQPAFEVYIRSLSLQMCPYSTDNMLSSACLKENASQLSAELDKYIKDNLVQVFTSLDMDILPQLLSNTSNDLLGVLNYFNRLFSLGENQQLYLQVTPWAHQTDNLKSKLLPLLDTSILNDDHLYDFFSSYSCLSRA